MSWDIQETDKVLKVSITGRFTAAVAPGLRDKVLSTMKERTNVLFDLTQMVHIDSSGLGVLVQILQQAKTGGGKVVLAGLQPGPKIVFDITKVSRVFEIVDTPADASFL